MTTAVTRIYRFSASHRLHSPQLGEAENARLYGKCNNPFGHGHDYTLEVTATGRVDEATGLLFPVSNLDRLVQEKILQLFASRNMNLDVPQFARLVPTTENLALVIAGLLQRHWNAYLGGAAHLQRVHIQETDRNSFEVLVAVAENRAILKEEENESITIHA